MVLIKMEAQCTKKRSKRRDSNFFRYLALKGSDQRENRGIWSNINTKYLVWRCGDGRSFVL
jgi:hypothetical protein